MKKIFPLISAVLMIASVAVVACKKSDNKTEEAQTPAYTCTSCTAAAEAKADNDSSSKGIYKGVLIGSTGTVKFNVANSSSTINAVLVIDGITVNLTSAIQWIGGQPYVAPFTGTLNNQPVSITFSVGLNGGSPVITSSDIPGHPGASFTLIKETSNALVEAFEGTYSTTQPESGTFNIILSRPARIWGGRERKDGATQSNSINGTIKENGELNTSPDGNYIGKLAGDILSGSFVDGGGSTVTVTGKRTL